MRTLARRGQAIPNDRAERERAHRIRQVELDLVVEVLEVQLSVFHAGQQAKDEEVASLPPEQVLDRRQLLTRGHHGQSCGSRDTRETGRAFM